MNWPSDFANKVFCGDCLEIIKAMPDECMDMVMTSPPYWGLRDDGIEQVFGGDKDCEHEWVEEKMTLQHENRNLIIGTQEQAHKKRGTTFIKKYDDKKAGFCSKCQAWKGQLGLEPTPEMYIEHLTEIFNEAKRVLKKEGTLWLNIGDTYWGGKGKSGYPLPHDEDRRHKEGKTLQHGYQVPGYMEMRPPDGKHGFIQPKCLTMIPERLAWSLIQNGWILRNKIIWFKPNSMPSSVKDRFSNRWEYIFLFSKSKKYYFDLDAVREPHKEYILPKDSKFLNGNRKGGGVDGNAWNYLNAGKGRSVVTERLNPAGKNPGDVIETPTETRTLGAILGTGKAVKVPGGKGWTGHPPGGEHRIKHDPRWCPPEGKNPGDFFEITTQPFPEAHFAVFPEKLCERPIKAGCPEQVCRKCGKARVRIIKLGEIVQTFGSDKGKTAKSNHYGDDTGNRKRIFAKKMIARQHETIGWTSCNCNTGFESGIVLDPFAGAGTVGVVTKKLGRRFILIDIKKEYCEMADKRIAQVGYQMELRV